MVLPGSKDYISPPVLISLPLKIPGGTPFSSLTPNWHTDLAYKKGLESRQQILTPRRVPVPFIYAGTCFALIIDIVLT